MPEVILQVKIMCDGFLPKSYWVYLDIMSATDIPSSRHPHHHQADHKLVRVGPQSRILRNCVWHPPPPPDHLHTCSSCWWWWWCCLGLKELMRITLANISYGEIFKIICLCFDYILCGENPKRSEIGKGWPRTDLWLTWKVSDDSEIFGFNAPWCEKKEELGVRCVRYKIQNTQYKIQPWCEKVEEEGVRCTMPWLSDSCWAAGAREAQQRGQHGTITLCCLKVLVENKTKKIKGKKITDLPSNQQALQEGPTKGPKWHHHCVLLSS